MSTPDVFLPLLFKVQHKSFDPTATNDLGNKIERWNDPEEFEVYGWGPPQVSKVITLGEERYVIETELMVPPGFFAKDRDRIQLEGSDDWHRVVGPIEDYTHNPFGWNPGSVVNLVHVKGAK